MRLCARRHLLSGLVVGLLIAAGMTGCGSSGNSQANPAVVGTLTDAPDTGQAGIGRAGGIVVPKGSYVRAGNAVSLRLDITNTGATADELVRAVSNVGSAALLTPSPIAIPPHGTVHVGAAAVTITLPVTGALDPGQTLPVTLTFAKSGQLLVYALISS